MTKISKKDGGMCARNPLYTTRGFAHAAGFAAARRCLRFLVCLFVRHAFQCQRDCAPDFAIKALEYRNDFDAVG